MRTRFAGRGLRSAPWLSAAWLLTAAVVAGCSQSAGSPSGGPSAPAAGSTAPGAPAVTQPPPSGHGPAPSSPVPSSEVRSSEVRSSEVPSSEVRSSATTGVSGTAGSPPAAPSGPASTPEGPAASVPRPDHVVLVVLENRGYHDVIGSSQAPFINELAREGALFTHSFAITHPSEPNYLALFSGSTHGLTDDSCPHRYDSPSLGGQLLGAGLGFVGYSDGLPRPGFTGCSYRDYARKHVPWVDFADVPASANQPFDAFPADPSQLPAVAFVIPDLQHDMHDGTVAQADDWLRRNLGPYIRWASTHRSLFVLTFDEDDGGADNHIPTIIVGDGVMPGDYAEKVTHYRLLRTLQDMFGLPPLGSSADTAPITDIWRR